MMQKGTWMWMRREWRMWVCSGRDVQGGFAGELFEA